MLEANTNRLAGREANRHSFRHIIGSFDIWASEHSTDFTVKVSQVRFLACQLELLNNIADPGSTNEIDQEFIDQMLVNFIIIQDRLENDLVIEYSAESEMCTGMRLYYTDFFRIYVCHTSWKKRMWNEKPGF